MTPEARQRRRIRTPVLAVTAVAWAVTLFTDPLRSASGAGQGLAAAAAEARLAHAGHAHHAVVDAGFPRRTRRPRTSPGSSSAGH